MKRFLLSVFFIFFFSNNVICEEKIAFIDMDRVISKSNSGVSILEQLNKSNKENVIFFKKEEKKLQEKKTKLISQKNIISETDFENNVFEIILAEQESKIIGIAFYYMAYSTWKGKMLFLEDFVVKEELRGQGIGKLIFRAYLEEARRQNVSIAKWQVLDWNEPAINFYEKYNSTIEKQWFNGKILKKDFDEIIGLM